MSFPPNHLKYSYQLIKSCKLITCRTPTVENLKEFEMLLNTAQPKPEDAENYKVVKKLYRCNTYGFSRFVGGTPMECLVLWTESKNVVNWLHLKGIVYIAYNPETAKYKVQPHRDFGKRVNAKQHVVRLPVYNPVRYNRPNYTLGSQSNISEPPVLSKTVNINNSYNCLSNTPVITSSNHGSPLPEAVQVYNTDSADGDDIEILQV